ncbi:N-succinylarginine dihydrolase [Shewanella marina]|uniref:N-succinylarginine dihydrolase n=1 Tax=Shewanella marina TaxID=487319 RepID=UPI00047179D0|nr:N-succinylarginine dihydrolase [Shewanella marina]
MKHFEANFDGLVGPTHNYAGLSYGNVASANSAALTSNPKAAAKQGLLKAKTLADLGLAQGILAPQSRPDINTLRMLGFGGTNAEVLKQAAAQAPQLLQACCSASSMWTANAATVSPSADTHDGKVHFTAANLIEKFHRSIEHPTTSAILRATFNDKRYFCHHDALPAHPTFGDEGAANHTRLCQEYGHAGLELFVYGREAKPSDRPQPKKFPARQTLEASKAVARLHQLDDDNTLFIQQNPDLIDQGVFHNDVIAVGNKNVLFYHQQAFIDNAEVIAKIQQKFDGDFYPIEVPTANVSVQDAINSYLFNTQLVNLPSGEMIIIAPTNCQENQAVSQYLDQLVQLNNPISKVHFVDVKQSMQNGGGPACLRLRVALNDTELAAVNQATILNDTLFAHLNNWIDKHYRDRLDIDDLVDESLLIESQTALDELTQLLKLGSVYSFQRN